MTIQNDTLSTMQPDERRALLAQLLREKARASKSVYPLSYGQRALWFIYQLDPTSAAYNIAGAMRIRAAISVHALQRVFQTLIDRHEALRTGFVHSESGVVQEVYGTRDLVFEQIDATGDDEQTLHARVQAAYAQPFDLAQGDVLRIHLFAHAPEDYVLLLVMHHIAMDGWSVGVVLNEFNTLYQAELAGVAAALPAVRQYHEFVEWQAAMLAGPDGQRLSEYWHRQLGGELPVLNLPLDKPRPQQQSFQGATHEFTLDGALLQGTHTLAKTERTTLYAVLLTAFFTLLHRYTDQNDIIVGTPMAARGQPDFQQMVGYMVSPVALRADLGGNPTFRSLLSRVRQVVLDALSHQDYPFALLVEQLRPPREAGRSPVFDAMFNLQRADRLGKLAKLIASGKSQDVYASTGLRTEQFVINQEEGQFDLVLDMVDTETNVFAALRYNTDLFQSTTIAQMANHFQIILEQMVANLDHPIGSLPLLTPAERQTVLVDWNATEASFPLDRCVQDLITEQARRIPHAVAALFEQQQLTYADLDRRSNQLAHYLQSLGVGPDVLVGVYLERSLELLVALLGILKVGGAYVPLDPTYPRERLAFMLDDTKARVLLTQHDLITSAPDHNAQVVALDADWTTIATYPDTPPKSNVTPEQLAYVIYTSGSTGRPKGVQIPHRALMNFLHAFGKTPGMTSSDVVLARTTLSFDPSIVEIFLPLMIGAQLRMLSSAASADPVLLSQALDDPMISIAQLTPSHCRMLLSTGWRGNQRLKVLVGGELLPRDLADQIVPRIGELWNIYGPTETTVWGTAGRVTADDPVTVGRPINNYRTYILNTHMQPVPVGVHGELFIGGAGMSHGYLNRPDLNATSFVTDLFSDDAQARMYRTGDLARYRPDGSIEILGRTDHQVKIRGFRIELGEIEEVLREHPGVREVVVVDREVRKGDRQLVAYITAAGERAPSSSELRRHLRGRLPDYMVPALFVTLDAIPLMPTGKVDRRTLPAPERERASADTQFVAPVTEMERTIAQIWSAALGIQRVSLHETFFDLGGHSLLAVETMAQIEKQTGIKLSPAVIRAQTLGQLATMIEEQQRNVQPSQSKEIERKPGIFKRILGSRKP